MYLYHDDQNEAEQPEERPGGEQGDGSPSPYEGLAPPYITYGIIAICLAISGFLNFGQESPIYEKVWVLLVPSCFRIWSGWYWGLITSAFVHMAVWHILFNMLWAKDFGRLLEPIMGHMEFLGFVMGAAIVSSGVQLAFSDQTGIGFSGVVYAMFGYGVAARHVEPRYHHMVDKDVIRWMLGWLVLCIVLTALGQWNVANGAHVGGFLFGLCWANAYVGRRYIALSRTGLAILAAIVVLSTTYMPWSTLWPMRQAVLEINQAEEGAMAGKAESQFIYAETLMQNSETWVEGLDWLRKAARQKHVPAMNNLAWLLATTKNDERRNGQEAVQWARLACEKDPTAQHLDTLAAAYAEVEDWDNAITAQERALDLLTDESTHDRAEFEVRLGHYKNKEKYRE